MIVQNFGGPRRAHLSFSVPQADLDRALILTRDVVHNPSIQRPQVVADANIA